MAVSAELETYRPRPQRRCPRHPTDVTAGVREPGKRIRIVRVTNLSARGCGFESRWPVAVGERAWLRLPGLESWEVRVVWFKGEQGGLEFARPLHPGVVQRFLLEGRQGDSAWEMAPVQQ